MPKLFVGSFEQVVSPSGGFAPRVVVGPAMDVADVHGSGPPEVASRNSDPTRGEGGAEGVGVRVWLCRGAVVAHTGSNTRGRFRCFGPHDRNVTVPTFAGGVVFHSVDGLVVEANFLMGGSARGGPWPH